MIITKAVGLGLAVAVFVDATIIRVLLVPATMRVRRLELVARRPQKTFGNNAERSS